VTRIKSLHLCPDLCRETAKDRDQDIDPNALVALVNKIEFMRMGATIMSLGRARFEPCSYFCSIQARGGGESRAVFLISLTNAARALGSGCSQTRRGNPFQCNTIGQRGGDSSITRAGSSPDLAKRGGCDRRMRVAGSILPAAVRFRTKCLLLVFSKTAVLSHLINLIFAPQKIRRPD